MLYIPKKIDEGALAEGMVEGGVEGDGGILLGQEGHPLLRDPGGHKVNLDYWPALKDKEVYICVHALHSSFKDDCNI